MTWDTISWMSLIIGAYLVGSFPTAYLASRSLRGRDIRDLGDGNSGAANIHRNLGTLAGITVAIVDMGKGALVVVVARGLIGEVGAEMAAGLAAVAGHNWPFYLQFRGGRGAATALGVLMALVPVAAVPMSLGGLILLFFVRRSIVALSFAFIPLPLLAWFVGASYLVVAYCGILPVVIGLSHLVSVRRIPHPQQQTSEETVRDLKPV